MDQIRPSRRRSGERHERRGPRPRGRPAFPGRAVGAPGTTFGEVVFNTGMSGYQETLTDPSYRGQIVVMTAAHIGNYGLNDEDVESSTDPGRGLRRARFPGPLLERPAARSRSRSSSRRAASWESTSSTRAPSCGTSGAAASCAGRSPPRRRPEERRRRVLESPPMVGGALALTVGPTAPARRPRRRGTRKGRVAAIDYGIKRNILRMLAGGLEPRRASRRRRPPRRSSRAGSTASSSRTGRATRRRCRVRSRT